YTIVVSAPAFSPQTQTNLQLTTGALPNINVTLQVGVLNAEISVTSTANLIDISQNKIQTSVSEDMVTALPKGRSFQTLIPLAPGARQEPLQGGRDGDRTNGYQIDGAADGENIYLIDGVNTTNIQSGGVGKNFQSDFIQEVQIKSSSFEAEFGGALGGVINAVPKRGSNTWHGEVKTYFQSAALDANDPCFSGFTAGGINAISGPINIAPSGYTASQACGLRINPSTSLNTGARLDGAPEYYVPQKDSRHVVEPGYDLGGPLFADRLWVFSSYIP